MLHLLLWNREYITITRVSCKIKRKKVMSPMLSFMAVIFLVFVVGFGGLFLTTSAYCGNDSIQCVNGDNFGYPFTDVGDGMVGGCGYPELTITCNGFRSELNISGNIYGILSKDEQNQYLRVMGVDVDEQECPRPMHNFTLPTTSPFSDPYKDNYSNITYFYNCSSSSSGYPKDEEQGLPCLDTYYNNTTPGLRSFAFSYYSFNRPTADDRFNWFSRNCEESVAVPVQQVYNSSDVKDSLKFGFPLYWSTPEECKDCEKSGGQCWFNHTTAGVLHYACFCPQHVTSQRKLYVKVCPPIQTTSQQGHISQQNAHKVGTFELWIILGVCSGIGGLLLSLFISWRKLFSLYSHWNSKIKSSVNMEAFLESCGCHGLQRYTYSQVKKMTNTFKEKLGQGGFGSVFKGKLPDGCLVAVKLLDESKGNGQDFINEVATIGWTNHVNVVRLLGFCCNGNKRALVYEFMPNGSLEKFIYKREDTSITNPPLGQERLYQIALGIAKGLEYLHCGCNTRILHFDIKPHNILLDQDFCPKISDFGLAKLCQTRESIVSMHIARGTMGYIAPEVACINFGGVSHKSDVYSYGMMILEMIGGRKNIDATVENISEIYFPKWIYNHFIHDTNIEGHKEIFKEDNIRKMVIVALHSIQAQPVDRPSISKIVEMLEGNVDELQMPPNPFQDPPRFSP